MLFNQFVLYITTVLGIYKIIAYSSEGYYEFWFKNIISPLRLFQYHPVLEFVLLVWPLLH